MKKNFMFRFFMLICTTWLLGTNTVPCPAQTQDAPYPVYFDYRDIPGVTEEEISAIEALKSKREFFEVGLNYSTESFLNEDGTVGGYSRLFYGWLSKLFGIPFRTELREWDDLVAGLTSHELDFTGELTATPERRKIYYMTDAIAERSVNYYYLAENDLNEIARQRTLRYAFLEGTITYGLVENAAENPFEAVFVDDYIQAVRLLKNRQIDAFFEENSAEAAFDQYEDIRAEEFFPLIYTPVSLSTASRELAPIIDVLQKYLDQGAIYHLIGLYNEGHREYLKHKFQVRLTEEEKDYLKIHVGADPIPIASESDNYPASFYNEREGEWQGIAHDVLEEVGDLSGLSFAPVNKPADGWPVLLDMLDEGQAALITELIPSAERSGHYLWPTEPYCTDYYALISLTEHEDIQVNQILYSTVALAEDTAFEEIFLSWFPNHPHTIVYPSTDDCFLALERGEVDFMMGSRNLLLSMTNYFEKPGFKTNIVFNRTYRSSFGLNRNEALLCSIIGKAQKLVDAEGISERWTRRVFDYRAKVARERVPYLIALAVLLAAVLGLLVVVLLRNKRSSVELERLVKMRTAELEIQTLAASEASRAKSDFLARMSNEIRTPLNAVIGMAEVAKRISGQSEKAVESIRQILAASNHLLGILNDVLDMSKIESGKFVLVEEPFALRTAMAEVADIIEQRCEENKVSFFSNWRELSDVHVVGDRLRLKQVLINLLGNAVKFTPQGGRIVFSVALSAEQETQISILFSVKDNGIGMSAEQVKRLFTPFEQTDDSISIRYGGTGLGLAISQNLVNRMGGQIQVESAPSQGSTFTFSIVLKKALDFQEQTDKEAPDSPDFTGKRILLAEDIDINRTILAELLSDTGLRIDEAKDGAEAVERFRESPEYGYDLIFMDIQMPILNGYEAAREIRATEERGDAKTIPIIAMTANAYKEDIDRALASGMNGHLGKPIDIVSVRRTLEKYLFPER